MPMLLKDRCIGVFDLESPELDAFAKRDVEILIAAGQPGGGGDRECAPLRGSRQERSAPREGAAVRQARAGGAAADPAAEAAQGRRRGCAVRRRRASWAATSTTSSCPSRTRSSSRVGDVSGKGVPAALYSVFAGELVRGRTFRRRFMPERSTPGNVLMSINTILHERQLEEYYCTLCYAVFDMKRRTVTMANSGLPYPIRVERGHRRVRSSCPGVPLGAFVGVSYDEWSRPLSPGDVFVFCSDGVSEAMNERNEEFTPARLLEVVKSTRHLPASQIVQRIVTDVSEHRALPERRHDGGRGESPTSRRVQGPPPIKRGNRARNGARASEARQAGCRGPRQSRVKRASGASGEARAERREPGGVQGPPPIRNEPPGHRPGANGMRRCQRLPVRLTHPADAERLTSPHIKTRAVPGCVNCLENSTKSPLCVAQCHQDTGRRSGHSIGPNGPVEPAGPAGPGGPALCLNGLLGRRVGGRHERRELARPRCGRVAGDRDGAGSAESRPRARPRNPSAVISGTAIAPASLADAPLMDWGCSDRNASEVTLSESTCRGLSLASTLSE